MNRILNYMIIFFIVLISLLILSSCAKQTTCNKPYILVGENCCLDKDSNGICDSDENINIKETKIIENPKEPASSCESDEVEVDFEGEKGCISKNPIYTVQVTFTPPKYRLVSSIENGKTYWCQDYNQNNKCDYDESNKEELELKYYYNVYLPQIKEYISKHCNKNSFTKEEEKDLSKYLVKECCWDYSGDSHCDTTEETEEEKRIAKELELITGMKIKITSISKYNHLGVGRVGNSFNLEFVSKEGKSLAHDEICSEGSGKCVYEFYINNEPPALKLSHLSGTSFFYYCEEGECLEDKYAGNDYIQVDIWKGWYGGSSGGSSEQTKLSSFFG